MTREKQTSIERQMRSMKKHSLLGVCFTSLCALSFSLPSLASTEVPWANSVNTVTASKDVITDAEREYSNSLMQSRNDLELEDVLQVLEMDKATGKEGQYEKVIIPNAFCGLGDPYRVFVRKGTKENHVAFGLQGGGACWNYRTCIGPVPMTNLRPVDSVPFWEGMYNTDIAKSPVADYTMVFFPYCTGDVYMAGHEANYDGTKVNHRGLENVEKALNYLNESKIVDLKDVKKAVVFGHSAGAIGSLVHLPTFDSLLSPESEKIIISDSPGMHFGERFWKKFTPELIQDYTKRLGTVGFVLDTNDGFVAKQMKNYCEKFPNWKIGVLMATRDFVMSTVFGNITPLRHRALMMGKDGLMAVSKDPNDNCSSWIHESGQHTFLTFDDDAELATDGVSAMDYVTGLVRDGNTNSYSPLVEFTGVAD